MPKNAEHEAEKKKLKAASARLTRVLSSSDGTSEFAEQLDLFRLQWAARGYPNPFDREERNHDWDESKRCSVYSGLYFDLRDLCDVFGLEWPYDASLIMRYLSLLNEDRNPKEAFEPDKCPPQHAWRWFRMANEGLGLPRERELKKARQKNKSLRGLTYDEITELAESDKRTIQNAIRDCWQYLKRRDVNLNRIAKLAGLDGLEIFILAIVAGQQPEK